MRALGVASELHPPPGWMGAGPHFGRQEFLQLMGLFRATIQHRRRVRLLVSGSAPFDELDRVWDDHFISARQIKLPFLDEPTAIGLLTQPDPGFPVDAI